MPNKSKYIKFAIYDYDIVGDDLVGTFKVPFEDVLDK